VAAKVTKPLKSLSLSTATAEKEGCNKKNGMKVASKFGGVELRCSILSERKGMIVYLKDVVGRPTNTKDE